MKGVRVGLRAAALSPSLWAGKRTSELPVTLFLPGGEK